jgi:hypothetical protein
MVSTVGSGACMLALATNGRTLVVLVDARVGDAPAEHPIVQRVLTMIGALAQDAAIHDVMRRAAAWTSWFVR